MGITTNVINNTVGQGPTNTHILDSLCPESNFAAKWCNDLTVGIYDDWFLPSKDELNKLFINKEMIGNFEVDGYWSSTEEDKEEAWRQSFYNGYQNYGNKRSEGIEGSASGYYGRHVRAIRTF